MAKKRRKEIILPVQPIGQSATLYSRQAGAYVLSVIVTIAFFAFGIGMLFEKEYTTSLLPLSVAGILAYGMFTEVKKLYVFEDTMFVEYLISTVSYKANEIESVEWRSITVMRRRGYEVKPILLIKTRSGKKIKIPPPGKYDIQKSISKWCKKYQTSSVNNVIVTE